jgi:hypothetical protein
VLSNERVESGNIFRLMPDAATPVPVNVKVFVPEEYLRDVSYDNPEAELHIAM